MFELDSHRLFDPQPPFVLLCSLPDGFEDRVREVCPKSEVICLNGRIMDNYHGLMYEFSEKLQDVEELDWYYLEERLMDDQDPADGYLLIIYNASYFLSRCNKVHFGYFFSMIANLVRDWAKLDHETGDQWYNARGPVAFKVIFTGLDEETREQIKAAVLENGLTFYDDLGDRSS